MDGNPYGQSANAEEIDPPVTPEELELAFDIFEYAGYSYSVRDDGYLASNLAMLVQLIRIGKTQQQILEELRDQGSNDSRGRFPTEMSHDVPAGTEIIDPYIEERTPYEEGWAQIEAISLGWPEGGGNGVGIQIQTQDGLTLFPRNAEDNFVAFNDYSDRFPLNYTLRPGETLVARTVNLDTTNSHFVNIVPHIKEVPEEVGRDLKEDHDFVFASDDDEDDDSSDEGGN